MNAYEKEQVEAIIFGAWQAWDGIHNDIPWQGCSIAGQLVDFKGDLPAPSNFKVESVSMRAEKLRQACVSDFPLYSYYLLRCLEPGAEVILLAAKRFEIITRKQGTSEQIGLYLDMSAQRYRNQKRKYKSHVLKLDQMLRPGVYQKKCA